MTGPAGLSLLARLRLRWQRPAADTPAGGRQIRPARTEGAFPAPSARSSLFHLRMEQKHRAQYEKARRGDTGSRAAAEE